jgi:hypothetical protein
LSDPSDVTSSYQQQKPPSTRRSTPVQKLAAGLNHSVAGDLSLQFETLDLPGDHGQTLFTFTAEAGSASETALAFLASWAASPPSLPTADEPAHQEGHTPSHD